MRDLRHPPREFAALLFQIEMDGRAEPYTFPDAEGALEDAFVERLQLAEPLAKPRCSASRAQTRSRQRWP